MRLPIPRRRHRTSFDQVSEFDRDIIVAKKDFRLFFREIDQRVSRNQATVRRIYHRWMQEETIHRTHLVALLPLKTDICATNGSMNDGHGLWNRTTLYLLKNSASACDFTMVGFKFRDTMIELHLWPDYSPDLLSIENDVVHVSITTDPGYTTRCFPRSNLTVRESYMDCCTPRIHPKSI
ncbi:hypothetical protein TNCV_1694211 [Trichonephila clavipes]|nr:hypothetical protein TNCV_1694211 [Trichonephila clavipes]